MNVSKIESYVMIIDNACTPQTATILHFWRKDNQTVMYMLMDYNYLKLMTKIHLQWEYLATHWSQRQSVKYDSDKYLG